MRCTHCWRDSARARANWRSLGASTTRSRGGSPSGTRCGVSYIALSAGEGDVKGARVMLRG
eukprot:9265844-Pyramimonas_sp.AAC.1